MEVIGAPFVPLNGGDGYSIEPSDVSIFAVGIFFHYLWMFRSNFLILFTSSILKGT